MQPDLSVEILGFRMHNPLMLASGILGMSLESLRRVHEAGAGAVITKSMGTEARSGYDNPTLVEVHGGYLNAVGLSNPGIKEFYHELSVSKIEDLPLIVSLFGAEPSEFKEMISILDRLEIKAYELNLSCPHVSGFGLEVGQDPEVVKEIIRAAKRETKKPLLVKLSPNVTDIVKIAGIAENSGADALTIMNTVRAMSIDLDTCRPILANRIGGLSGPAIRPVAVRCVYEVSRKVGIPVVGCGGIVSWQDAVEFFLAGAEAVQIGTAIAYEGLGVFEKLKKGIRNYLIMKEKRSVKEIVGLSHDF